ncbi:MAG TPA: carboxypeptidase regulatory-like domain-containing protein, partial [Polyangia bacterium]|nr:carboxypeptidase regulatory-like domain-containing protein [Polyangia bacterium]
MAALVLAAAPAAAQVPADLPTVARELAANETPESWSAAADLLARMSRWPAAAKAQRSAIGRQASESERLVLARYELYAGDLESAAQTLEGLPQDSRPARWLRAELALARDDPNAALSQIEDPLPPFDDAALARRLDCSDPPMAAATIDRYLSGLIELAKGDTEAAVTIGERTVREAPSFADGRVLLANALHAAGRSSEALRALDPLLDVKSAPARCPAVLLDRVYFNAGNIAADMDDSDRAEHSYAEALRAARARAAALRGAIESSAVSEKSPLIQLLKAELREPQLLAPDVHNNYGHLLLRLALAHRNDRALLDRAEEELGLAAENGEYGTRQYAYLGLARAALARGDEKKALDMAEMALTREAQYEDALDFLAERARMGDADITALAGLMLAERAAAALPERYARSEYKQVLEGAAAKLAGNTSPLARRFAATLDAFNGHYAEAEAKLAQAPSSEPWTLALRTSIAARRGDVAAAQARGAALERLMQTSRPETSWDAAALAAAATSLASIDPVRAEGLVKRFVMPPADVFPWLPAVFGVLTDKSGSPLPGGTVAVKLADGSERTAVTDESGRYEIAVPTAGTYELEASLSGMQTFKRSVTVGVQGAPVSVALKVSSVTEQITVTAEPVVLTPNGTITLPDLPRKPAGTLADWNKITPTGNASLSGSSVSEATYVIDGLNVTGTFSSDSISWLADVVRDVKVAVAGMPGDQRDNAIQIASRSGTNDLSGSAQVDGQRAAARAPDRGVAMPTAMFDRRGTQALHATFGGPIVSDHLWYYAAADLEHKRGRPSAQVADVAARARGLHLFAKLNGDPAPQKMANILINRQEEHRSGIVDDIAGVAFGTPESTARDGRNVTTSASLFGTAIIDAHRVLEGRATRQVERSSLRPASPAGDIPQIQSPAASSVAPPFFTSGGVGFIDDGRRVQRDTFSGSAMLQVKEAEIRLSGWQTMERDHLRDRLSGDVLLTPTGGGGLLRRFWSLVGSPVHRIDEMFEDTVTTAVVAYKESFWHQRIQLDADVRWDRQHVNFPTGQALTTALLQPHLGMSVNPLGDGKWLIGASISRMSNPLRREDIVAFGTSRRFEPGSYGGLLRVDPDLRAGAIDELTASAGRELTGNTSLQVFAFRRKLRDEIEDFFCDGLQHRCIGNPGRGIMSVIRDAEGNPARARGVIDRVQAALSRRGRLEGQLLYRWQRSRGNTESPDLASTRVLGIDPYTRPAFDTSALVPPDGPYAHEHRHRVDATVTRTWDLAQTEQRIILSTTAFWQSGEPRAVFGFSQLYGRYVSLLAPRGSEGHSPSAYDVDLRSAYELRIGKATLQLTAAVRNALNRQTALVEDQRESFAQNPAARPALERLDPRTGQLFARVTF